MTVPHKMVELERMSDDRGVGVKGFPCIYVCMYAVRDCSDNNTYYLPKVCTLVEYVTN